MAAWVPPALPADVMALLEGAHLRMRAWELGPGNGRARVLRGRRVAILYLRPRLLLGPTRAPCKLLVAL